MYLQPQSVAGSVKDILKLVPGRSDGECDIKLQSLKENNISIIPCSFPCIFYMCVVGGIITLSKFFFTDAARTATPSHIPDQGET